MFISIELVGESWITFLWWYKKTFTHFFSGSNTWFPMGRVSDYIPLVVLKLVKLSQNELPMEFSNRFIFGSTCPQIHGLPRLCDTKKIFTHFFTGSKYIMMSDSLQNLLCLYICLFTSSKLNWFKYK